MRRALPVLLLVLLPLVNACGGSTAATDAVAPDVSPDPGPQADSLDLEATAPDVPADAVEIDAGCPAPAPSPAPSALPWSVEADDAACANGEDDDQNGYTDCADFGCSRNPAVTVCVGAVYEHAPTECANGQDDDGDGLTDCADPDCAKNPFHAVCPRAALECGCAEGVDGDGDGLAGCADHDCLAKDASCPLPQGGVRVLFDQTLDETAAFGPNSDWVVDAGARVPSPSNPADGAAWAGALSSFAFDLHGRGFAVESLLPWEGRLTFGDTTNPQDLARYGVLVVVEPSRQMMAAEKEALVRFVQAGGGLLAVANHLGADRDGNGWSAPQVWNDLVDANPVGADPFGFRFDPVDVDESQPLDRLAAPTHPVLSGPAGTVRRIGFYQGCSARLTGTNASATALVQLPDAPDASTRLAAGVAEVGAGRVVFLTDSAIAGDGTDSHGTTNASHDAWHSAVEDNRAFFVNAVEWLSKR